MRSCHSPFFLLVVLDEDLPNNERFAHSSSALSGFQLAIECTRYIQCNNHTHPPYGDLYTYYVSFVNTSCYFLLNFIDFIFQ